MSDEPPTRSDTPPIVLFDGVCNLCNAWVRWLVEHDRKGTFRLASLQSNAARALLAALLTEEEIEALPDSIVLIDEAGVHTRSTAPLRVAGRLGWPWKALAALQLVPSFARDLVYRWIAASRYRWFGRRDACMVPTPGFAERFLDADEPRPPVEARDPAARDTDARTPVRSWALRLVIAYLILYMMPFPFSLATYLGRFWLIGDIPWIWDAVGWVTGRWDVMTNWLTGVTGGVLFGIEVAPQLTGSGDQTFHYVELVMDLLMALGVSLAWSAAVAWRRVSATVFDLSRVLVRFNLGWYLLIYGWIKVFPLQMPAPGPDRWLEPFGDLSPMGLVWQMLGASMAYQIFSGACEAIAGYLVFFRRTALAGSLFGMAVVLNVMALNYFYDVPVKLFSTHLFLAALFIAAPDLPRLVGMVGFNLPTASDARQPFWKRLGWSPRVPRLATLFIVGVLTFFHISDNLDASRQRGVLAPIPRLEGVYRVESFEQDGLVDREVEDDARWVRLGINMPSLNRIQRANGDSELWIQVVDTTAHTWSLFARGESPPDEPQFTWTEPEMGVLRLEGTFEGRPTVVVMRKEDYEPLLTTRGFHWINERPLNR